MSGSVEAHLVVLALRKWLQVLVDGENWGNTEKKCADALAEALDALASGDAGASGSSGGRVRQRGFVIDPLILRDRPALGCFRVGASGQEVLDFGGVA